MFCYFFHIGELSGRPTCLFPCSILCKRKLKILFGSVIMSQTTTSRWKGSRHTVEGEKGERSSFFRPGGRSLKWDAFFSWKIQKVSFAIFPMQFALQCEWITSTMSCFPICSIRKKPPCVVEFRNMQSLIRIRCKFMAIWDYLPICTGGLPVHSDICWAVCFWVSVIQNGVRLYLLGLLILYPCLVALQSGWIFVLFRSLHRER